MPTWILAVLVSAALVVFVVLGWVAWSWSRPKRNGGATQEFDDPMDDPEVRAMLSEVIRTGRPMTMNRGEAPRFVDTPKDN